MTRSRIMQPGHRQSRMARSSVHGITAIRPFFFEGTKIPIRGKPVDRETHVKSLKLRNAPCNPAVVVTQNDKFRIPNSVVTPKQMGTYFRSISTKGISCVLESILRFFCIDFRVTPSSGKCLPNQNFREIHPLQCMT